MSGWGSGYITDVEYASGFCRGQSPVIMQLACWVNGIETAAVGEDFAYCELGCGKGLTSLVLAASNPRAQFLAVDFNPVHVMHAASIARAAGLENIEFLESSFEELVDARRGQLPQFDFVTLHGVYSWISPAARQAIVRFLSYCLKPGGLVYISYNAMPGWAPGLPVQRLLKDIAAASFDRSDRRALGAVGLVQKLAAADARALAGNQFVDAMVDHANRSHGAYLAHEYLNEHWSALYHADVARDLSAAKLEYVGSAGLLGNVPELRVNPEQRELLRGFEGSALRETLWDFCTSRRFRDDVFIRGAARMGARKREKMLRNLALVLLIPRTAFRFSHNVLAGEAKLEPTTYGAIADALAERPQTVDELLGLPETRNKSDIAAVEIVSALVGTNQALPVRPAANVGDRGPAERLNRVLVDGLEDLEPDGSIALALPAVRSGVPLSHFEASIYGMFRAGAPVTVEAATEQIWRAMCAHGRRPAKDGKPIEDESEAVEFLRTYVREITETRVPLWQKLWPQVGG
jgi:SAM-dependent methyltransferase